LAKGTSELVHDTMISLVVHVPVLFLAYVIDRKLNERFTVAVDRQ
jgi:hypothetical protein